MTPPSPHNQTPARHERLLPALMLLAVLAMLLALHRLGAELPGGPTSYRPGGLTRWLRDATTPDITIEVLRLSALAIAYQFLAASLLSGLTRSTRFDRVGAVAEHLTLPPLRGLLRRSSGAAIGLLAVLLPLATPRAPASPTPAVRPPPPPPDPAVTTGPLAQASAASASFTPGALLAERVSDPIPTPPDEQPAATATLTPLATGQDHQSEPTATMVPLATVDPELQAEEAGSPSHPVALAPLPGPVTADVAAEALLPEAPPAWTVHHGDHLWSIAELTLLEAWSRAPTTAETDRYWRALVAANPDLANPDLVIPGQLLQRPPIR